MSFHFSNDDVLALNQDVQDLRYNLASDERGLSKRVVMYLESSRQRLDLWFMYYLGGAPDALERSETLWGKVGSTGVQRLLAEIKTKIPQFQDVKKKDSAKINLRLLLKRALIGQTKKTGSLDFTKKPPSALDVASELGKAVDELWMYSYVTFDSMHDHSPAKTHNDDSLDQALRIREGAVTLYKACQHSGMTCNLDINLTGIDKKSHAISSQTPSSSRALSNVFYHLFREKSNSFAEPLELVIQNITHWQTANNQIKKAGGMKT